MELDAATLRDLDVLSTATLDGQTLLALVDRTRTSVGREQLRRKLRTPEDSADRILGVQNAHRTIAANAREYRSIIDRAYLDETDAYLNSKWQLPGHGLTAHLAPIVWPVGWRAQYLADLARGQAHLLGLLGAATALRDRLCGSEAGVLAEAGCELGEILRQADLLEIARLASRRSAAARLAFDQLARGQARALLAETINRVGRVEAMWSLAVATEEHAWVYPTPSSRLSATRLSHPFLGPRSVPYDVQLNDEIRVCFITGPNMAGKSTFLRAVGLSLLLAHLGCGVPAEAFEFLPARALLSSIKVSESLPARESFYLAEVRRVRAIAKALHETGSVIAILDEPLRGTNVHDAAEATAAVMTRLAANPGVLAFVASHVTEAVPALGEGDGVRFLHFAADVSGEEPRFDYQLREGVSHQRLGMTLLRREGVLGLLESTVPCTTRSLSTRA